MGLEKTVSVKEAADMLGVHVNSIHNWIKSGRIAAFKINQKWHIPLRELEMKAQWNVEPLEEAK